MRATWNYQLRDFFSFIREMDEAFEQVRQGMGYENPIASHKYGDDRHSCGWAGVGMLPIAIYLFYLRSWGVKGKVLECGVFKGGSTCCLSHVCRYLGLELVAADSFCGLPASDEYYDRGDFHGSLEEVRDNMVRFGCPEVVTYIKGVFAESLKHWNDPLMLLWLDVDLKQSVLDVLEHTYPALQSGGVIFCDGLGEHRDFSGDLLQPSSSESSGLVEFFSGHEIIYQAVYSGFGHMGLVIPGVKPGDKLIYTPKMIRAIHIGSRPWREKIRYLLRK